MTRPARNAAAAGLFALSLLIPGMALADEGKTDGKAPVSR